MRTAYLAALLVMVSTVGISTCQAQGPQRRGREGSQSAPTVEGIVNRMMAFDKNKDGKLSRNEITDPRLLRVFDRADANHDGVVTREEMTELAKKMIAEVGQSRGGPGGGDGVGGPGGDDGPGGGPDGGPGGFGPPGFGSGGPGGFGPPKPGQVLPSFMESTLSLTPEQKTKIAALQKEVDEKLGKILTKKQKAALETMGPPGPPPDGDGPPDRDGPPPRDE